MKEGFVAVLKYDSTGFRLEQGWRTFFEGASPNLLYISKKVLSRALGNFEEQNKVLEPCIIIINYCIIFINSQYNYII